MTDKVNILPKADFADKLTRVRHLMTVAQADTLLLGDNANLYYLTGRIFLGYMMITHTDVYYFLRRPSHLTGEGVHLIHKPENIPSIVDTTTLGNVALELNQASYATVQRLAAALGTANPRNADTIMMEARAVKTRREVEKIKLSSDRLTAVYRAIPRLYRPGMSDIELQIEIEHLSRQKGNLGIFRINGQDMELNMGSVLVGENADTPSPYDFAMGGAGADPSLPAGADGTIIRPGHTVMVDTNGDFTGYMTDMTRTFACGYIDPEAIRAHRLSIDICHELARMGRPGTPASALYHRAVEMARQAGLEHRFMGHRSQAGFVGHGVGIAINELPVIAPRSQAELTVGNVIALEPKFVMPHTGAVGIENTYVVRPDGMECLTTAPEELIELEN